MRCLGPKLYVQTTHIQANPEWIFAGANYEII